MKKKIGIVFRVLLSIILIVGFIYFLGINFKAGFGMICLASSFGGLIIGLLAILIEFHGVSLAYRPGVGLLAGLLFGFVFCLVAGLTFGIIFCLACSLILDFGYLKSRIQDLIFEIKYQIDQIRENIF